MWLPRPFYETLPYLYGAIGLTFLAVSWVGTTGWPSAILLITGSGLLIVSVMLWLRRKDFRDAQRQYNRHSLEQSEFDS